MKTKEEQGMKALKIIFGVMLIVVVLFLLFGEIFMPVEDPTESGECVLLEAGWERVHTDGRRESITLPTQCDAERGEVVRLEITLPQNQSDTCFCMRASQQDMRVFVGDELRKEYTTKGTRLFGKNSASAFVFFNVSEKDAGKVVAIEVTSDSEFAGFLNEVYVGDKYDIVSLFVEECSVVILVSFCMLILSAIVFFMGCILRLVYNKSVDITYLGLGVLQLSMAMISESRIRQFFLPNSSIAAHVGFLLTILIPYPFIVYISRLQKGRYEKVYRILLLSVAANFVISTLLQLFNIVDLADSSIIAYGLIILMVITIAITIVLDIKRGKIDEYGELVFGIAAMLVVTIWEMYVTFVPQTSYYGGVMLSFGLIILLFVAGFKTARDMLATEKEKQMAILAGEAKTQFLANMSHEIRTPINTIIGMNEMILRENQEKTVVEYAKNIQNASRLLLGLINDILDFSKIEAGKMDIVETDYYLSKMVTDVMNGIQIKADSKEIALKMEVEETMPSVLKGDEIRIRQILNNLLSNAVKYTHQGMITLAVKGIYEQEGFALCISVEDTGMGIKPKDLDKLFDSFQRLEEKKNRYIEGTGLGLNITKQLVELMGGNISVKSEYGKGSCFTVIIPQQIIDDTAIGMLEEAYQRDTLIKGEMKSKLYAPTAEILVVDDNEMNLAVVEALLRRTGIKLTLANSGVECLELCRSDKYDLILMDHMMPEPDGIETLHFLRRDESSLNRTTDVIVLTANAIAGMAEKYMKEGFTDYLSKPIIADALEEMICRYLPEDKMTVAEQPYQLTEVKTVETDAGEITYIDRNMGLQYCANSEEMYQEMLDMYYAQGQQTLQKLTECYIAHDWKQYKVIVHALKGTSLMIGAVAFSEKAKKLENAASDGAEEIILAEHEKFMEEYQAILKLVHERATFH